MKNERITISGIFVMAVFCLLFLPLEGFSQTVKKPVKGKTAKITIKKKQKVCTIPEGSFVIGSKDTVSQTDSKNSDSKKTNTGKGVLNGNAVNLVQPPYPPAARAVRASGVVNVQVLIDETGKVVTAEAVSGHPLLRQASEQAALQSKFSPTTLSGCPVKVSGIVVYNFQTQ